MRGRFTVPVGRARRGVLGFTTLLSLLFTSTTQAGELVRVENHSRASSCAEDDNVDARFIGAGITRFAIEARHPSYISAVKEDSTAPDFSTCNQSNDPVYSFEPLDVTLYEDADYRLVGHRFSRFWRPEAVDFHVGATMVRGLHLVQLVQKRPERDIEILVVYPSDGYWRIKPLPPPGLSDTAYGSSFLVGPIQEDGRPYVALSSIEFVRSSLSFRLSFRNGSGELHVAEASPRRMRVEISLPRSASPIAFAGLRSMFVSPEMADTAEAVPEPGHELPVLAFPTADVATATFARSAPSRHNTTAPDISFGDFARQ